jgi:hypothetical protein
LGIRRNALRLARMIQMHAKSEPETRGPEELNRRFSDRLGAVFGGFSFGERETDQGLERGVPEHRFKTDKRWTPREARERREELARVQQEQRPRRFLARMLFFLERGLMNFMKFMRIGLKCRQVSDCGRS